MIHRSKKIKIVTRENKNSCSLNSFILFKTVIVVRYGLSCYNYKSGRNNCESTYAILLYIDWALKMHNKK